VRHLCFAAVLLALPLTAAAQQDRRADRRSDNRQSEQRQSDQRESGERSHPRSPEQRRAESQLINRAFPMRGQTPNQTPWWERQGLPSWETKAPPAWERPSPPASQHDKTPRRRHYQPSVVYVLPQYRYFADTLPGSNQVYVTPPPPAAPVTVAPPIETAPMGALRLEVEPRELLQIFVDGKFMGTPSDLADQVELAPGTRHIQLRARGYKTLDFDVQIADGREITYRGALEPELPPSAPMAPLAPQAPLALEPPSSRTTIYLIPGCYLGNVAPKASDLRPGCDLSKLTKTSS
jgi:hypothetical protein